MVSTTAISAARQSKNCSILVGVMKLSEEDQRPAQHVVYARGNDMTDAAQNEVN